MDVSSSEERPWYGRYNHEPRFAGLMTIGGVSRADEYIREGVVARIRRPAYEEAIASLGQSLDASYSRLFREHAGGNGPFVFALEITSEALIATQLGGIAYGAMYEFMQS
jgi:hypothetical protein